MKQAEHNKIIASIEEKYNEEINKIIQKHNEEIAGIEKSYNEDINEIEQTYNEKYKEKIGEIQKKYFDHNNENAKAIFLKGVSEGCDHAQIAITKGFVNLIQKLYAEGVHEIRDEDIKAKEEKASNAMDP